MLGILWCSSHTYTGADRCGFSPAFGNANVCAFDVRYIPAFDKWSATYTYDVGQRSKSKSDSGLDLCEAQNGVYDGTGTEPRRRLRTELQAPVRSIIGSVRLTIALQTCRIQSRSIRPPYFRCSACIKGSKVHYCN